MHATYGFLIAIDPNTEPGDIGDDAIGTFAIAYAEPLCDENNWWTAMVLVLDNGQAIPLIQGEDWRGREGMQARFLGLPQEQRWEEARKWCLVTAALDLGLEGAHQCAIGPNPGLDTIKAKAEPMSARELAAYVRAGAPGVTTGLLEKAAHAVRAGEEPLSVHSAQSSLHAWYALQRADEPPFSQAISDPYDNWRFFDLRDYGLDDRTATLGILFVDIHT
ncbi:MAG: hypothetical protein JXM73_13885 [Anaerolineae bacterium]|nr:hypothetical protein [Anaerolineae bacterium]